MSEIITISAEKRERVGKGAARATRRENKVPAVIYGEKAPPVSIKLPFNAMMKLLRRGGFMKTVFTIDVEGTTERAIPRALQLDPVKDLPIHVDFLRVSANAVVTVEIHVNFVDEDECPGLVRGGALNVVRHALELNVPADAIPDHIDVSLKGFDIGDSVHISHVTLPPGCTPTITDRDFTICSVVGAGGADDRPDDETGED